MLEATVATIEMRLLLDLFARLFVADADETYPPFFNAWLHHPCCQKIGKQEHANFAVPNPVTSRHTPWYE